MSLSTIHIDADEILGPSRAHYRLAHPFDDTTSLVSPKINTRLCLTILSFVLIVIALISIAGLIIAIYSLVLSTRNADMLRVTSTTSSTNTANATATPLQCSSSPTTTYVYSTDTPPQCVNYTLDADETRNIAYGRSINGCDNIAPFKNSTSIWIRFQDPAGRLVANSPVPPNFCGTVAAGWYAGQYPNAFFSTATSIVCYYYSTNTCTACNLISVTNCRTFYVFLLPQPPSCNYRYCTL